LNIKKVGIQDLQKHLSSHINELKQGDTLVITKRGRPVARVVPVKLPDVPVDEKILLLIAAGLVSWNGRRPSSEGPRASVRGSKTVADLLLEDRD
jgi:prevent-host-death family protein